MRLSLFLVLTILASPAWADQSACGSAAPEHRLEKAITDANDKIITWLAKRSAPLATWDRAMFGPTLDGTYFYRLGEQEQWDVMSLGDRLMARKEELNSQGFPQPKIDELELVLLANNSARAIAAPQVVRCAKHFPGGDERIELTERDPVFFSSVEETKKFLRPFEHVLESAAPPTCMMLSHGKYRHEAFGAAPEQSIGPLFPIMKFEDIPASVNPGIISYLRNKLNFKGVMITDYALMGAFFGIFKHWPVHGDITNQFGLSSVYAATYTGIDLIPSVIFRDPYTAKGVQGLEKALAQIDRTSLKDWNNQLNLWLLDFSQRIGAPLSVADVSKLSLVTKIYLKTPPFAESDGAKFDFITKDLPLKFAKQLRVYAFGKDIWNRSGVMTLLQRQYIIESLTGRSFALPPSKTEDENKWYADLFADATFKQSYAEIKWDQPQMLNAFCRVLEDKRRR